MSAARVLVEFTDDSGREVAYEFHLLGEGSFIRVEMDDQGRPVTTANCSMINRSPGVA